jgi:hypothetical protein
MDSVYAYRSPLRNSPPKQGEALGVPNTRSLVIVLIDALRYDTSQKSDVMPFLNQLKSEGASALMHSRPPSYSEPSYTVLLTGAWPDLSDGPVINLDYADIPTFTQDNIYSAAHRAGLLTAVSGFNWFEKLIPQQAVAVSFYTPGEDQVADRQVTDAALPWLREGKYQLMLVHLDQIDYAGHHEGGPIDPRWDAAATRADELLKEIASAMDLTQDTLLIISDHGQIDRGGHGGQDPIVLLEPFVLVGKGVIPGKYADVQMVDVTPTVAAILGTNIPATNQGHPLVAMFDFTLTQVDNIKKALSAQQAELLQVYQTAIGHPVTISQTGDITLVFLFVNLAAWHAKPHFTWMLVGVASYLLIFNIKYILIDYKTYSLSSVIDASNLIASTAFTTLLALFVSWLLVILGTNVYRLKPRKAADLTLKFILTTLSILSVPIFVHYVINGATVTWALPNFFFSFLGLLFLIQVLMVAAIGIFFTGLAALIGFFAN